MNAPGASRSWGVGDGRTLSRDCIFTDVRFKLRRIHLPFDRTKSTQINWTDGRKVFLTVVVAASAFCPPPSSDLVGNILAWDVLEPSCVTWNLLCSTNEPFGPFRLGRRMR
jgi:hypothetical protein